MAFLPYDEDGRLALAGSLRREARLKVFFWVNDSAEDLGPLKLDGKAEERKKAAEGNLADIVELQSAFWRKQFGVVTAQGEEIRVLSTKVTAAAVEQGKRGARELRKAT